MSLLSKQRFASLFLSIIISLAMAGCAGSGATKTTQDTSRGLLCPDDTSIVTTFKSTVYANKAACVAAQPTVCKSTTTKAPNATCNTYCAARGGLRTCIGKSEITSATANACFPVDSGVSGNPDYQFSCVKTFPCSCV